MLTDLITAVSESSAGTDPGDLIKWIVASVGLLVFLGATAQYLKGSADKGTISSLKDSVSALQTENGILKQQREEDRKVISEQGERISKLEGEKASLMAMVTQAKEIAHLQNTLEAHHVAAMSKVEEIIAVVKKT